VPGLLHEQSSAYSHIELQLAYRERDTVSASYNHALYLTQRVNRPGSSRHLRASN